VIPVATSLVIRGNSAGKLARIVDLETGASRCGHTLPEVYGVMLTLITRHYSSLPDPRTLTMSEIRFFYAGLRPDLREAVKPRT
jgi:hypothetical protein